MGWDAATGAPGPPFKSEGGSTQHHHRVGIRYHTTPARRVFLKDSHIAPDPQHYATQLRHNMQRLQPVPPAHHMSCKPHQSKDLSTCTHVFIRRDAVLKALQPPYDGPFQVLKRAAKFFVVLVNCQRQTISIDCVKTAHLEVPLVSSTPELPSLSPPPPQVNAPAQTTHSGRHVHFPERFVP